MADRGSFPFASRLDFQQLMVEAQHRWLRPAEICEILRNYQRFQITPEPPKRPPSGSLFLFDRKVLRYFRKDGHNWRKKKDRKTVKEAHEKLKVGSVDVLHCYYAHSEENEGFQRRCYWSLEQDLTHIVFVHYLEVKGNKTNVGGIRVADEVVTSSQDYYLSSRLSRDTNKTNSWNTDSASPTSTLTSLCEDADSGNHDEQLSISGVKEISHAQGDACKDVEFQRKLNTVSRGDAWQLCRIDLQSIPSQLSKSSPEPSSREQDLGGSRNCQTSFEDNTWQLSNWSEGQMVNSEFTYELDTGFFEQITHDLGLQNNEDLVDASFDGKSGQSALEIVEPQRVLHSNLENNLLLEGNNSCTIPSRKLFLAEEGLAKNDSFSRWIAKELGDVEDLHVQPTSDNLWTTVECENVNDESSLSPSISQDQLFRMIDYLPKWAYRDSETEVFVIGTFLKSQNEVAKYKWSCMFGELEVPAEVLADGVLCCHVPSHRVGQVPFYVTCSNRLSCSEVREFEYLEESAKDVDVTDIYSDDDSESLLFSRFQKLLSIRSLSPLRHPFEDSFGIRDSIIKIMSSKEEEDTCQTLDPSLENKFGEHYSQFQLLQKLMKEKYYLWLIHKVTEDGKGASILDSEGQGAIHLAAALGYDWAIKPIIVAGLSINFRDVNGWTSLHWAAFCGRENTVAVLTSLGAATGALTDPSPAYPLGRTPADLASGNGHKGISGFLAETSLTSYLSSLTMKVPDEAGSAGEYSLKPVQIVTEKVATPTSESDAPEVLSLKDSLIAVCNAKQAAACIHQVFRMQSFQRKQMEYGCDGSLDEHALSFLAAKIFKPGQQDWLAHSAATQIQKKFRGWKKRKEFLIIRQRIIKIQAHVRGRQVRKQYKKVIWSVGILEKIILRWRRKGRGLRGFRKDNKEPSPQGITSKEDDYDFLKEGRKHTEERLQKALTRVKSMVHYPGARDQYRRLLTVVEGIREPKACDMALSSSKEASGEEDMTDIEPLMDGDAFMSAAFE